MHDFDIASRRKSLNNLDSLTFMIARQSIANFEQHASVVTSELREKTSTSSELWHGKNRAH